MLVCRIPGGLCALPLHRVVETMRPLPVEPVAAAPAFVAGVAIVRGAAIPVVDAARLIAPEAAEPASRAGRFVTLNVEGGRTVALAVGDVVGLRTIPSGSRDSIPPLLKTAAADVIEALTTLDSELLIILQAGCLLPADMDLSVASASKGSPS
jgi:purine-binding chemotaxis protein CheW